MQLLRELLSRATADGSRTNALNHLHWMIAAFLVATLASAYNRMPNWVTLFLAAVMLVFLACYLVTHFYFMLRNPDALRSEKFTIEKMAIERGLYGDSESGIQSLARSTSSGRLLDDGSSRSAADQGGRET